MTDSTPNGFASFLEQHASDFARIAGASRREWTKGDVSSQAWLLAYDIGQKLGRPLDLANGDDASLLIRHLHNHCVKYTETVVRHAQRLDHAVGGDDERSHHWLMDQLVADNGAHALSLLEAAESPAQEDEDPDPYHSPAAGFAWLLRRFDQRMADVATFLLISLSWCHRCYREARCAANNQWPLPDLAVGVGEAHAIRPWRQFKLPPLQPPETRQLDLDFSNRPVQPSRGQLWLL